MNEIDWEKLARYLGIADLTSRVPDGARLRFELGSMPQQQGALAMLLAAAALIGLAFWLYRREGQAALWKKFTLATLRTLTIGLAFLVILEPRLAVDVERTDHANTIILWDESLSMSLPDRYLDEARRKAVAEAAGVDSGITTLTRQEIAWRIIERANLVKRLEERNRVKLFAFGDEPRLIPGDKLALAELKPKGGATDLARGVRRALEEQGGRTVAAIVAITDGRLNKGEGAKAVAAELKDRAIPFYGIGIGDPTPPKNLELYELRCNERAYKNDPIVIEGFVRHRGYEGEVVDVEFYLAPADNPSRQDLVKTEHVTLGPENGPPDHVSFTWKPTEVGKYIVTLKVPPRDEELVKEDNQRSAPVAVIDDETRVLLISGGPTYEYRHLVNMLVRDKTVTLSVYLESADDAWKQPGSGGTPLEGIPRTKEEIRKFDVICLLDPNPAHFDRELVENIKDYVEHQGGGLLYVAGEKYTTAFLTNPDLNVMLDLIPVVPDTQKAESEGKGPWSEQLPYKLTDEAEDSAITRLDQNLQRSKAIWQKVPGAFWHYPVTREKPGAAVLVRQADERSVGKEAPLVITHFYGPGRTMFNATDETWRWRAVAPKSYDRFWIQALRYLVEGRLLGGVHRAELSTDKNEYELGDPV
ncbi:MAG TPA: vWA domain-containing protein, partial [Planctomycetota bacterium]|nr:vWA domain-containing protein [Planctomycetota bacterium]